MVFEHEKAKTGVWEFRVALKTHKRIFVLEEFEWIRKLAMRGDGWLADWHQGGRILRDNLFIGKVLFLICFVLCFIYFIFGYLFTITYNLHNEPCPGALCCTL